MTTAQPFKMKISRVSLPFILGILFCIAVHINAPSNARDFFLSNHTVVTMSHAITFDQWVWGNGTAWDTGIITHPGLPYFLASGLAWEAAKPFSAPEQDPIVRFFDNIDKFWISQAVIAGLIFAVSLSLFSIYANAAPLIVCMPLSLLWCIDLSGNNSVVFYALSPETFAILLALLFFMVSKTLFFPEHKFHFFLKVVILGIIGALGYLNKMPYIALYIVGFVAIIFTYPEYKFKVTFLSILIYIASFVATITFVIIIFGHHFLDFFKFHFDMLFHTKMIMGYVKGEQGIFDIAIASNNFLRIWKAYPQIIIIFITTTAVFAYSIRKRIATKVNYLQFTLLALCFLLYIIALLKRYQHHYGPLLLSLLPLMAYEAISPYLNRGIKKYICIAIPAICLVLLGLSLHNFSNSVDRKAKEAHSIRIFVENVDRLYVPPGGGVYWTWGTLPVWKTTVAGTLSASLGIPTKQRLNSFYKMYPSGRDETVINVNWYNPQGLPKMYYLVCQSKLLQKENEKGHWRYLGGPRDIKLLSNDILITFDEVINGKADSITRTFAQIDKIPEGTFVLIKKALPLDMQ